MGGIQEFIRNIVMKTLGNEDSQGNFLNENEKYRTLLELAPDAFVQFDAKGNIIAVNNKTVELSGYSKEEFKLMNITSLFTESILIEKPLRIDLLKKGYTIKNEREIRIKSGETIQVETNTNAMPDGTYQSFVRDISDRKQAEEVIRVSEARLKRAELVSKSGNWELHLDTQMMVASEGATKIYGVDKDQMEYAVIKKVPLPEFRPAMDLALKELIEDDKPYDIEFKIKAVDTGEIKDIRSIAIFDKEKRILFGAILYITQQKRIDEELIKAKEKAEESDRLKTAFLQNLSHEIRTPMNAIMGFSELMTEEFDNKDKLQKYSGIINNRCNDLLDIINDILDIAKIESGQLFVHTEECSIPSLFEELSSFFAEYQKRLNKQHISFKLESHLNPSKNVILADKVKLKQILINLINNALKFTHEGSIEGGCREDKENHLLFYVKDTGIGIFPDKHEVIFNRFVQLNQMNAINTGGNGLGLSIVKGLVNLLGGEIYLESEPGKGSTFYFTIPYEAVQPLISDSSAPVTSPDRNLKDKTVLIIEDDPFNREYLKELLTGTGIKPLYAADGEEGVTLARNNPVDLVLLDIRLPDKNGYDVSREIRKYKPDVLIVAHTAYASFNEKQKAISAGCNDYLSKPTKKEILLSLLSKHLSGSD